jgi:peroxiredoxin Q/BCP
MLKGSPNLKLKPGNKAPDFTATDQNGNTVSLSDYKGKKVVIYFYPQDDTQTCTKEACNLRDNFSSLKKKDIVVLGVSPDDEKSHKKFEAKFSLPFTLLADTGLKIIKKYGVWGEKLFMGRLYDGLHRTTFLVNEAGKIDHIITNVKSGTHAQQILETWGLG